MAEQTTATARTTPDLRDIQGNLIGFNKDHQRLVFLRFADQASGRAFLAALEPNVANGYEVRAFNDLYKELRAKRGGEKGIIEAAWTNVALTAKGLVLLQAPGLDAFPQEFLDGMAA